MPSYTEHYKLIKPNKTDNYNIDVANTNSDVIDQELYKKVEKIPGKGLSTNDFTNGYKRKLDEIEENFGITSETITNIKVVDVLPETEENGVLYLVKEGTEPPTPVVENLYPAQTAMSNTENGCTVSYVDKQVTINGTPSASMWGWTQHFEMPLESGKSYAFKLTNFSGSFDNSARVEGGGDDIVVKVLLYGYLADDTEVALINKEISAADIYNNINFGVGNNYVEYYLSLQAKGNVAFSNWTCDISITEV